MDGALFGDEERDIPPLEVGEISGPIFTQNGIYIVRLLTGPTDRDFSNQMRNKLNVELVTKWQTDEQIRGANAGWLRMNFNSKWYAWVADQVRLSAPRGDPGQQGAPGQGAPGGQGFPGGPR